LLDSKTQDYVLVGI